MEIRRDLELPCSPERLFSWVDDLELYPQWMRLIHHVELAPDASHGLAPGSADGSADSSADGSADDPGDGPAWIVELRARVGPFARSKVLRMVRSEHRHPEVVTFERREIDGRQHSTWTLRALVAKRTVGAGRPDEADLTMELVYGGSLWSGPILQRVFDDAVRRGSERLLEVVSEAPRR